MANILIVEDDDSIRNLIKMTLSLENYDTAEADNGQTALELIREENYDLVLLDIMLPQMDGYQLLQRIKDQNIPTIFLTAKISLQDKVFGLKLGADDYITKPFEPIELLARIETVLRRSKKYTQSPDMIQSDSLVYNDIEIHVKERSVKKAGREVTLTAKEFDLLLTLVENLNIVFSREQLLDKIWGYDYYGNTRTVDVYIKQLRKKLDLKGTLETVFRVGYKLKNNIGDPL